MGAPHAGTFSKEMKEISISYPIVRKILPYSVFSDPYATSCTLVPSEQAKNNFSIPLFTCDSCLLFSPLFCRCCSVFVKQPIGSAALSCLPRFWYSWLCWKVISLVPDIHWNCFIYAIHTSIQLFHISLQRFIRFVRWNSDPLYNKYGNLFMVELFCCKGFTVFPDLCCRENVQFQKVWNQKG